MVGGLMKLTNRLRTVLLPICVALAAHAQTGPDPREIPLPRIKMPIGPLPGVKDLLVRNDMPDAMTMNDGTKVTTPAQWQKRREEIKRIQIHSVFSWVAKTTIGIWSKQGR